MRLKELRAKLFSLEEKYEALEKRFNAVFSATLLQKVVTEDKETTTEPTTKATEQKKTRKTAVKVSSSLSYSWIQVVMGEILKFIRAAAVCPPRRSTLK